MKTKLFQLFLINCVALLSLMFAGPGLAHGDEPRLEVSADRLHPGAVLDLRGVDFEFEEEITLALIGPAAEIALGSVIANTEGVFLLTLTLPADLAEGTYVIRGTTDDHTVESPAITVWGTALLEGGEQGLRDEDDGLLAPMPTFAPATSVPQVESPAGLPAPENQSLPVVWIAAGTILVLLISMVLRVRRS